MMYILTESELKELSSAKDSNKLMNDIISVLNGVADIQCSHEMKLLNLLNLIEELSMNFQDGQFEETINSWREHIKKRGV